MWRAPIAFVAGSVSLSGCVVATSGRDGGGGGAAFLFLFLPFVLFAVLASRAFAGRRHRYRPEREPAEVNVQLLRGELSVLADDVIRLEPQVQLHEEARDDYEAATHRYRVAQAALEHSSAPLDLARVQRVVDEAAWSMSRVRAILGGRRPPPPPEPLRRPGPRGEPAIDLSDGDTPVYIGSPAPYRSGWFGGGAGGLFGGLLLGSMLGGFGGVVVHDSYGDDADDLEGSDGFDGFDGYDGDRDADW